MRDHSKNVRQTDRAEYTVDKTAHDAAAMDAALGARQSHPVGHDWGDAVVWGASAQLPGVAKSDSVIATTRDDADS